MWTIVWNEPDGSEHYDRFETREDIVEKLEQLAFEFGITPENALEENVLIFPPDTEVGLEELIGKDESE